MQFFLAPGGGWQGAPTPDATDLGRLVAANHQMISPGVWWSGSMMHRSGFGVQAVTMSSTGMSSPSVLGRRPKVSAG